MFPYLVIFDKNVHCGSYTLTFHFIINFPGRFINEMEMKDLINSVFFFSLRKDR